MDALQKHVDQLFRRQKNTRQTAELKEEILGNLKARRDDLIREGFSLQEAEKQACRSITSIQGLIDGNRIIDSAGYKAECAEWILIYLLIAWILSIPAKIVGFVGQSAVIFLLILFSGGWYLYLKYQQKTGAVPVKKVYNRNTQKRRKQILWSLWLFLFLFTSGTITVVFFGSDLWFGREIRIDGPFQFARMVFTYFLPLLSIIIPLCYTTCCHIADKYEVGDMHE